MMKNNVVLVFITIRGNDPSVTEKKIRPRIFKDREWVTQTVFDEVWVYYRFNNEKEAKAYYGYLEENFKNEKHIGNIAMVNDDQFGLVYIENKCTWKEQEWVDLNYLKYMTGCGEKSFFHTLSIPDPNYKYCPYCSKQIDFEDRKKEP